VFKGSVTKISQLMLYMKMMAVYSESHTKRINIVYGQNVEFLNCEPSAWEVPSG